ncbi:tobamovirus multiplication protein 2B-like [Apium graveolens]|uniref:tobamovirus multiplication protein 2B-like n=1 Tax=Apium graveolens TaxID=4045 RepID=UPI003D7A8D66
MNRKKELMAAKLGGTNRRREDSAKATVSDHLSQTIKSTSNLLQLMLQSSPSQAQLRKLPKNLVAKTSTIRNTRRVLNELPPVVSSLDAHTENGLKSGLHLNTILQINETIKICQLKSITSMQVSPKEPKLTTEAQPSEEAE